jgi:hypothetical protein
MNLNPDRRRRPVLAFACGFAVIFGALSIPFPKWNEIYGGYFRAVCRLVFVREGERRILRFDALPPSRTHRLDTQITLANRDRFDRHGNGPAVFLALDSRGIGWIPTEFLAALVLATPVPWRRRTWCLLWGLLFIHLYIVGFVGVYIWNHSDASTGMGLINPGLFWKRAGVALETILTQSGANFSAPVLLWILLLFRREDWVSLAGFSGARKSHRSEKSPDCSPG